MSGKLNKKPCTNMNSHFHIGSRKQATENTYKHKAINHLMGLLPHLKMSAVAIHVRYAQKDELIH